MKTKVVLFEKENFVNLVAGIEFIPTFAVLKVDELNHLAGQAVNLLNRKLGFFYAYTFTYWRPPIRK